MGFGVHWLRPSSKVPVKSGWSSDSRDDLRTLQKDYVKGFNIGTKLGKPSKVSNGYLAVIDVDVKGTEKKHKRQAEAWIEEHFPGLLDSAPITMSGRGNGSMHVWVLVESPIDSRQLTASPERVEVFMPSVKSTAEQIEKLGERKVKEGWRLRPAFEIDFMCAGRQVALPPSIHPDTGREYKWKRPIENVDDLTLFNTETLEGLAATKRMGAGRPRGGTIKGTYEIVDVDELELDLRLNPDILEAIYDGSGVDDRSAMCLSISMAMLRAEFTHAEILGVLTNKSFFIGDVAYEHAKTANRQRAARWADAYCLQKAITETDVSRVFDSEIEVYETLSEEEATKQTERVTVSKEEKKKLDWRKFLDRTDKEKIKPTLKNVILILENAVGAEVFKRDLFGRRDYYGINTPWGGVKNEMLTDDDTIEIKVWLADKWTIEPHVNIIFEAMVNIAKKNSNHPVREYLTSIEWDGTPRLDNWLETYLGASGPQPFLGEVSRKFLIAAVARIFEPGRKFDHMLILEGRQGKGKSSVGSILASPKWFLDSLPDLQDKDAALNLQGIWFCEMGELVHLKKNEVETTKAFVTRQIDKVRPPYGKRYIESARQCVFFGTTNKDDYLKDKTGNRRFWTVKVDDEDVDFKGLTNDRDQLWAEAFNAYEMMNEKLYLEGEAKAQAETEQDKRVVEDESDVISDLIFKWCANVSKVRKAQQSIAGEKLKPFRFQTTDLFNDLGFNVGGSNVPSPLVDYRADNYRLQMASAALRRIGFQKIALGGRRFWKKS